MENMSNLAIVHFYRTKSVKGAMIKAKLRMNDKPISTIKRNWKTTIAISPGKYVFSAKTEATTKFELQAEQGKEYYVKCGMGFGILVGRIKFTLVDAQKAQQEMIGLNEVEPLLKKCQKSDNTELFNKEEQRYPNNDVHAVLHIRFNIAAVGDGSYGKACYQFVFTHAPVHALNGCEVSMGDSNATLAGRENVCIIGLTGPDGQLRSIMKLLTENSAFQSVCANNPLVLNGQAEPLVGDGIYTEDGNQLKMWAKAAFESVKNNNKNNMMIRCKNCGWENSTNNDKCEKCNVPMNSPVGEPGASDGAHHENVHLKDTAQGCPNCGYPIRKGEKSCPECGNVFDNEKQDTPAIQEPKPCEAPLPVPVPAPDRKSVV